MSLKIKHQIWKANTKRTNAQLIQEFVSESDMEKYLSKYIKCQKNKTGFNNGWHEWNDSTAIKGFDGSVRSICDFCGLMIVDCLTVEKQGI